jgi:hypothetical protein
MKKFILFAIVSALLSANVYADWDAAGEAREAAEQKAGQERNAREKAEHDKRIRESTQKQMRAYLGKDAAGKSDAEVERIYNNRQSEALRQAAAVEAAVGTSNRRSKKSGDSAGMEQGDAAMKAMYGKSVNDIGSMSDREREAFFKEMEKKYPK